MRKKTATEAQAWRGFLDTHARLASQIEVTLHNNGLSLSEYRALLLAEEAGNDGVAMGTVADKLGMSCSGFTRLSARLLDEGYLNECRCPEDGRVRLITITADGQNILDKAREDYYQDIDHLFWDHLSDKDLNRLGEIWQKLAS